ncbi:transposase [Sinorhizobium meliloti]|uniref:transposase n=1 Tax=Rhizobium meliloti TaxID=382 RepID=UPI00398742B0
MRSVAVLMGFDIALPDFSTLSRRSKGLALPSTKSRATTSGPVHLVVDSTGLKVFGEGEWLENKHKTRPNAKDGANCTLVSILSVVRLFVPI